MIEHFRLGFANRTLGYRLPEKTVRPEPSMRGRLKKLGILRESGHEHFNGSVVIPVFNLAGEVVQMYGRKITRERRCGKERRCTCTCRDHIAACGTKQALVASKEIILCEALIDALTFWCAGFRHVTASYGVNGFTDDHRAAFRKARHEENLHRVRPRRRRRERARSRSPKNSWRMGIECFRVQFPKDMDANEYALKVTPAAKSLRDAARTSGVARQGQAAYSGGERARASRRISQR